MEEKKKDLRVRRTEEALERAMAALMESAPYDAITVSDLCDAAMIRRATFYAHFQDKHDFLHFCLQKKQRQFITDAAVEADKNPADRAEAIFHDMLRYMLENKPLLYAHARECNMISTPNLFVELAQDILRQHARQAEAEGKAFAYSPDFLAACLSGMMLQAARWWIESDNQIPMASFATQVRQVMDACIPALMTTKTEIKGGNHERKPAEK